MENSFLEIGVIGAMVLILITVLVGGAALFSHLSKKYDQEGQKGKSKNPKKLVCENCVSYEGNFFTCGKHSVYIGQNAAEFVHCDKIKINQ